MKLSSDILEAQFGPTDIEILYQAGQRRIIRTRVLRTDQTLEFSEATFAVKIGKEFEDVHAAVLAGESIGKAFRSRGIPLVRQEHAIYQSPVPPAITRLFGVAGNCTVIEVKVLVGEERVHYGDLFEMYSPGVRWPTGGADLASEIPATALELAEFIENHHSK